MNVLFSSINSVYRTVQQPPTDRKNLSGVSLCFLRIKYCLSVGETCGLPWANAVRPYRVLGKYFVIFLR